MEWSQESRFPFGLRLPLIYHASGDVVLGFGPDLMCETLRTERQARVGVRVGMSSWIGYSF